MEKREGLGLERVTLKRVVHAFGMELRRRFTFREGVSVLYMHLEWN